MSVAVIPAGAVVEPVSADEVSFLDAAQAAEPVIADRLVESDLLVEDVSIDGMCGVY